MRILTLPRRRLLLALIPAAAIAGCNNGSKETARVPSTTTTTTTGVPGQPAAGASIQILALNWPQAAVEQRLANETFTPKTGIKVTLQQLPYDSVEAKMKQVIQTKNADYDLVHYDSQWLGQFVAANGLERLDTPAYLDAPDATAKFDDFLPEWSTVLCKYPTSADDVFAGKYAEYKATPVYGLPWATGCQILFYRKDLLDAAGQKTAPETWEQFATVAQKLTSKDRFGAWSHAGRAGDYITQDFFPIMWANGGRLWDSKTWTVTGILNSPTNVKSLQSYVDWNRKLHIVPSASANWTNEDVLNAVSQDKAAMGQFWGTFGAALEDAKQSKVVGKMAYAPVPGVKDPATGKIRRAAMYGCQGSAITAFSKHKKEAWQYLQWLTSKETQKALLDDPKSAFVSARKDLLEYTKSRNPRNKATLDSTPFVHDFWNNPEYSRLLDVAQRELNSAWIGAKPAQDALDTAAREIQKILDTSPYKPKKA